MFFCEQKTRNLSSSILAFCWTISKKLETFFDFFYKIWSFKQIRLIFIFRWKSWGIYRKKSGGGGVFFSKKKDKLKED